MSNASTACSVARLAAASVASSGWPAMVRAAHGRQALEKGEVEEQRALGRH